MIRLFIFCSNEFDRTVVLTILHVVCCLGSNRHNNNAPGGDGQTGDAGEGQGGRFHLHHLVFSFPWGGHVVSHMITFQYKHVGISEYQ